MSFDRDLERLLRAYGCTLVRHGKGSHSVWKSGLHGRNFTVPKGIVSRHTANEILKQSGIPERFR